MIMRNVKFTNASSYFAAIRSWQKFFQNLPNLKYFLSRDQFNERKDPDVGVENPGKGIFEIRIPNFCYIQVIVFDLSYLPVAAVGA